MDKPIAVTPNKIQRLIHIAEDNSYRQQQDEDPRRAQHLRIVCESSSGLLDLDNMEALETMTESEVDHNFLTVSTTFNPGEMTGRSTGAEEVTGKHMPLGRHSMAISAIASEMDKQSHEVNNLLRHSICNTTTYSFQSKRDLTADEVSLVMREAPLPVHPSAQTQFPDSLATNSSALSVGAYFQKRCSGLEAVLGKTDSPDKSAYSMPSISEVNPKSNYMDESLDCVPVRQSRLDLPEKLNLNNPTLPKNCEKQTFQPIADKFEKNYLSNKTFNYSSVSNAPEPRLYQPRAMNPVASSSFASNRHALSSKPTDVLIRNMQAALRLTSEETEESACPTDNSISISKIADFLGKESNVSVSAMLQYNNRKKPPGQKPPLSEAYTNFLEDKISSGTQVTSLSETRKLDTASSTGTITTVIQTDRLNVQDVPTIVVSNNSIMEAEGSKGTRRSTRSKSPSSKSQSTLSTVQENYTSFKSGDSPLQTSAGEVKNTRIPSPNIEYRELDKSVDWHDVLQQKRHKRQSLAKDKCAEIVTSACSGFVGVSCAVNCAITTLTDNWFTANLKFDVPIDGETIIIEQPRLPLLSPGKTETFTFYITTKIELDTSISYTMCFKDSSIDLEVEQKGSFDVQIKMPMIQAMSSNEVNKVTFPPIQETCSLFKSFILVSDCPADLQLELSIVKGDTVFSIKSVQVIAKSDVNKVLMEQQASLEEIQVGTAKTKGKNKQLCRLSNGNAIRVTVNYNAPKLSEFQTDGSIATCNGALNVNLIGLNTVLRKVDLIGSVGTVNLVVKLSGDKLHLTSEPMNVTICNMGSVNGVWVAKAANTSTDSFPFKVAPGKFGLRPGAKKDITLSYMGPEDTENSGTLIFEDLITGYKTGIKITGGSDVPKTFPIKTNHSTLSFVRPGRLEINLKNSTNKKIHIRMMIKGEGFYIDLPGLESKGVYCLPFAPSECRTLSVVFDPSSNIPYASSLHLVHDKNSDLSRNVRLFGCSSGDALRWAGLVAYNELAHVRATARQPVHFELFNKSAAPAFLAAKALFHFQYNAVEATARLTGNRRVVGGRTRHSLSLIIEWSRVERCAKRADTGVLATLDVLTGAEFTRRRILKIIRDESSGVLDTSLLPDRLKVLAEPFDGEDPSMDNMLTDFRETKASLPELIGGLKQLTAQVVLSQDYENTIVIPDDTVVEHHTLCD